MPELPEVETTRRGIKPYIKGLQIKKILVRQHRLRWPVPEDINDKFAGSVIRDVGRRAKYLLLETNNGTLIIHLGMSGCLRVINKTIPPTGKHDHVDIMLSNDILLRYTDPRRFGAILTTQEPINEHDLLKKLGPEPLSDDFTGKQLFAMSRGRTQAIKTFIMNSHIVAGVGNIYATESLFKAGIRPNRSCGSVSLNKYNLLADSIIEILNKAIEAGGTTLKDFVGSNGKPGYFKQQLKVYGQGHKPCKQCGTIITEIRQGGRSTCFCKRCQH